MVAFGYRGLHYEFNAVVRPFASAHWACAAQGATNIFHRPPLFASNIRTAAKQLSALGEDPTGLSRLEPAGLTWRDEAAGRRCSWLG